MTTLLTIHQLSYQVGKQPILSNVNLTVEEGDWLTIGGPSGSGKSSLLKLIASLQTPTSGAILYQGNHHLPARSFLLFSKSDLIW